MTTPSFTSSLKRPAWVNSKVHQRAILVPDATGSMAGAKARDAKAAMVGLVVELAKPENKGAFDVALVPFDTSASVVIPLQRAADALPRVESLDLLAGRGGTTNITCGLEAAESVVAAALADGTQQLDPVVLLFSDGGHNTGPHPEPAADRLKAKGAFLVCVAFGSGADEALLTRLASPQGFFRCRNGAELRAFFAAVGATLAASLPRGVAPASSIPALQ